LDQRSFGDIDTLTVREYLSRSRFKRVLYRVYRNPAVMLLLGHSLYQHGPGEREDYGRFRDLNLGRVIASAMAVTSVVAFLAQLAWLQSVAFVMFAVFSLQGIAIMHWLHAEGMVPVFLLVLMYGTMVVLSPIVVTAMAVLGYIDAWFNLRRRRVRPR
jgi:hypothetical protein